MDVKLAALKLGSELIRRKLGQFENPGLVDDAASKQTGQIAELPTTPQQQRDRSAKVHPPRVITTG